MWLYTHIPEMECPRCHSPLIVVEYDDVELDFCTKCEGLWFDSGEMQLVAAKAGRDAEACASMAPARTSEKTLKCPLCHKAMNKRFLGIGEPVVADVCPACDGLWLDKGELEQVLSQSSSGSEDAPSLSHLRRTFGNLASPATSDDSKETGTAG